MVDTETLTDASQALLYGAFRYLVRSSGEEPFTTVAEGIIYADDLPQRDPDAYRLLLEYARTHRPDVGWDCLAAEPCPDLLVLPRREFNEQWLWRVGYPHRGRREPATLVFFNAPFDLSRLALAAGQARGDMAGGFSLTMWHDERGAEVAYRPRLAVKSMDSKRAFKKWRAVESHPEPGRKDHAGHFLDLRSLVFALTSASHTLNSACRAFGVPGKFATPQFGIITLEGLDYCRQDVAATAGLFQATLAEYARHPIGLQATQAYSPASIAKGYLAAMGVTPRLEAQPDFPDQLMGYATEAFYGGRAECHLRNIPVPVTLLDFTSMYPSVNALMGTWQMVTAQTITTTDVTDQVRALLARVCAADCFDKGLWRGLFTLVEIIPEGDVLPVRANYGSEHGMSANQWTIGVNHLHTDAQPRWYTLPDVIASTILTGKPPQVVRAIGFRPEGRQHLTPISLYGTVAIDPNQGDFFTTLVEQRRLCKDAGDELTAAFLKVLANAGSYGIYAEMVRHEQPAQVSVHSGSRPPFTTTVNHPETPGTYAFPPIAACITGAARLMLALLEHTITTAGGTWVFCDTDSMAIVATPTGADLIACPGGTDRTPEGHPAIRALSHAQVETIRHAFDPLNPYDPALIPDLLKVDTIGECLAISAKRYRISDPTTGALIKFSRHGLGLYRPPTSTDGTAVTDWIQDTWQWLGRALTDPDTPLPAWADQPALTQVTISSPFLLRPFHRTNAGRPWAAQVQPFNFLYTASVDTLTTPPGGPVRLVAPYASRPDQPVWYDLDNPTEPAYTLTTEDYLYAPPAGCVRVHSYADIIHRYRTHPEHKFDAPDSQPCRKQTVGILSRTHVHPIATVPIGKESNRLEEVDQGLITDPGDATTTYQDTDTETLRLALAVLAHHSGRQLAELLRTDRRTIDRIRRKGQSPRDDLRGRLLTRAVEEAAADMHELVPPSPGTPSLLARWHSGHLVTERPFTPSKLG